MGFFEKIKTGLTKTRNALNDTLGSVFSDYTEIGDDFYDELEECLILADLGVETSEKVIRKLRDSVRIHEYTKVEEARLALKAILSESISPEEACWNLLSQSQY